MKDKQTAEEAIELISGRIMDEYRKHQSLDWAKIAARKIHSQWFEYYNQQNQELQRQVEKLKDAADEMANELEGWDEHCDALETYKHLTNKP